MTHNSIAYYEAQQTEIRNLENARHNKEAERLERRGQDLNYKLRDFENQLLLFREHEVARHNAQQERIQSFANYIDQMRVFETQRSNRAREYNDRLSIINSHTESVSRLMETERHNKSMEEIERQRQDETVRHNRTTEKQGWYDRGLNTYQSLSDSLTKWSNMLFKNLLAYEK